MDVVESFLVKFILWYASRLRLYSLLPDKSTALSGSADVSVREQYLSMLHEKICMNIAAPSNSIWFRWTNIFSMTLNRGKITQEHSMCNLIIASGIIRSMWRDV